MFSLTKYYVVITKISNSDFYYFNYSQFQFAYMHNWLEFDNFFAMQLYTFFFFWIIPHTKRKWIWPPMNLPNSKMLSVTSGHLVGTQKHARLFFFGRSIGVKKFFFVSVILGSTRRGHFWWVVAFSKRWNFLYILIEKLISGPYEEVYINPFFKT